jgi:hypothetical protein
MAIFGFGKQKNKQSGPIFFLKFGFKRKFGFIFPFRFNNSMTVDKPYCEDAIDESSVFIDHGN